MKTFKLQYLKIVTAVLTLALVTKLILFEFISISDGLVAITAIIVFWYSWETSGMRKVMVQQLQATEAPLIILYVRYYEGGGAPHYRGSLSEPTDLGEYCLRLRNVGPGAALNVLIEPQSSGLRIREAPQFLAPKTDEQSFSVTPAVLLSDLDGVVFRITCETASKKKWSFVYKITNLRQKEIEFIERNSL